MKVFCQICKEKSEREDMIAVEKKTAKTSTKKYYHEGDCHATYLQQEEQKQKESADWDTLCKFILAVHGKEQMPDSFPSQLRDLRNGTIRFVKGGKVIEKKKEGQPYDVILEAYKLATNDIQKAIRTKAFEHDKQAFNYCFKIAKSKINALYLKRKRKSRLEEQVRIEDEKAVTKPVTNVNVEYKGNNKSKTDISDFLDD